jgi:hypothetical protein
MYQQSISRHGALESIAHKGNTIAIHFTGIENSKELVTRYPECVCFDTHSYDRKPGDVNIFLALPEKTIGHIWHIDNNNLRDALKKKFEDVSITANEINRIINLCNAVGVSPKTMTHVAKTIAAAVFKQNIITDHFSNVVCGNGCTPKIKDRRRLMEGNIRELPDNSAINYQHLNSPRAAINKLADEIARTNDGRNFYVVEEHLLQDKCNANCIIHRQDNDQIWAQHGAIGLAVRNLADPDAVVQMGKGCVERNSFRGGVNIFIVPSEATIEHFRSLTKMTQFVSSNTPKGVLGELATLAILEIINDIKKSDLSEDEFAKFVNSPNARKNVAEVIVKRLQNKIKILAPYISPEIVANLIPGNTVSFSEGISAALYAMSKGSLPKNWMKPSITPEETFEKLAISSKEIAKLVDFLNAKKVSPDVAAKALVAAANEQNLLSEHFINDLGFNCSSARRIAIMLMHSERYSPADSPRSLVGSITGGYDFTLPMQMEQNGNGTTTSMAPTITTQSDTKSSASTAAPTATAIGTTTSMAPTITIPSAARIGTPIAGANLEPNGDPRDTKPSAIPGMARSGTPSPAGKPVGENPEANDLYGAYFDPNLNTTDGSHHRYDDVNLDDLEMYQSVDVEPWMQQ